MTSPGITEFLLARIAEDEALAQAATQEPWAQHSADPAYVIGSVSPDGEEYLDVADAGAGGRPGGWQDAEADAAHIVRHDPARVLAECDAKRRIVELCNRDELIAGTSPWWTRWPVLQSLALPHADHPDYDESWRP